MMKDVQTLQQANKKEGRKALFYLLSFFVIFASVDAFFVYKAISTHTGVVAENAYEIGLNYNDVIAEAKKQKLNGSQ
jgi:nitrogen fixation protein FixH